MSCPKCGERKAGIYDTREDDPKSVRTNSISRRRKCPACGFRFKTREYVAEQENG